MAGLDLGFGGLASGIDTRALIQRLVAVERRPIALLERRQSLLRDRRGLFEGLEEDLRALRDRIRSFKDPATVLTYSVSTSDPGQASASATGAARPGSHALTVTQLARAEREASQGYAGAGSTTVGTGTLTLTYAGTAHAIAIAAGEDTLNGVAAAVNRADVGVRASVVNEGSGAAPYRLVLSGRETGAVNAIEVDVSGLTGGTQALSFSELQGARDALFRLDGLDMSRASNTVSDAQEGIVLRLAGEGGGEVTLSVVEDGDAVVGRLRDLVADANKVLGRIRDQFRAPEPGSGPSTRLAGDATLRSVLRRIQDVLSSELNLEGTVGSLAALGIRTSRDGTLTLDETRLREVLDRDFPAVAEVFVRAVRTTSAALSVTGFSAATRPGTYEVVVTRAAERATVGASTTMVPGTLLLDETLTFTRGGTSAEVALAAGMTLSEVVAAVNARLSSPAFRITASASEGRLVLTSEEYGEAVSFSVVSDRPAVPTQTGIGTTPLSDAGVDVAGSIGGRSAAGSGAVLTGAAGGPEAGLAVRYSGTSTGGVGSVTVSGGVAHMLEELLQDLTDPIDGLIDSRKDAIDGQIGSLGRLIEQKERRLELFEERLKKRFSVLEGLISRLQSQQAYFAVQSAGLF